MKAFVLAAGLGTRLRPWTEHHPKALVPVGGVPMLQRVICRLRDEGFDRVVVNVHHFADQIVSFLEEKDFGVEVIISDESEELLNTGGGLLCAARLLSTDSEPFLVHNVDILSDAPLASIMQLHKLSGRDISLVTSPRESSRKLVFNDGMLRGWCNLNTGELRPTGFEPAAGDYMNAFSGIYVVNPQVAEALADYSEQAGKSFPVMDFFMYNCGLADTDPQKVDIGEIGLEKLNLIDIGKPDTLSQANSLF